MLIQRLSLGTGWAGKTNHVIGFDPLGISPTLGWEGGLEIEFSHVASVSINHADIMKPQ